MDESQDSAAFTAEWVTVDPSRAEHVQQVLSAARATLARCRADEFEFRARPAEPPGAPARSRDRPLAPRDRTTAAPASAPAPQPDTQVPTWADERAAVFEAICALRHLGETLSEQIAELRHAQTRELGMLGAWRALKQWGDEECTRIEAAGRSRDDEGKEEPFEIPPLHALRQT